MSLNQAWAASRPKSGMIPRKQETLKKGLRLARIGHSLKDGKKASDAENLASPWWLSVGTLEYLWGIANSTGESLSLVVRRKCCIPYYWSSSCDLIYEVELAANLSCWIGPGTYFFPEKDAQTAQASPDGPLWPNQDVVFFPAGEFPQIFVPGLWDPSVGSVAWRSAARVSVADLDRVDTFVGAKRTPIR